MVEIKFKSMKELKKVVLGIILISSFSLTAQDTEESKINSREVKSIEKISHFNSAPRIEKKSSLSNEPLGLNKNEGPKEEAEKNLDKIVAILLIAMIIILIIGALWVLWAVLEILKIF